MTIAMTAPTAPLKGHLRISSILRSEWIKMRTVRSTMWSLAALVVVTIGVAVIATVETSSQWHSMSLASRLSFDPTNVSLAGLIFSLLVIGVLGVLVMSAEYGTGTIRSSLAAVPRRPLLLVTKTAVFAAVAFVVGEVLAFASFLIGQALLTSPTPHASLSQPGVLRAVVGGGLMVAVVGLLALGLATIIRHTAGALTAFFGILLVLPALVSALPSSIGNSIAKFLPLNIANTMTTVVHTGGGAPALSPWAGFAVVCGYAIAALIVGGALMVRRDA
jgi:ABC-2 type transport system permease protein